MKKPVALLIAGVFALSVAIFARAAADITFADAVDNLDAGKATAFAIKSWFAGNKGKRVIWSGEVVEVEGKPGKVRVVMANFERPTYKGYNLIMMMYGNTSAAGDLKIGQKVEVSGIIHDYKPINSGGVIMYLGEGRILK